jgi:hypothetical protein
MQPLRASSSARPAASAGGRNAAAVAARPAPPPRESRAAAGARRVAPRLKDDIDTDAPEEAGDDSTASAPARTDTGEPLEEAAAAAAATPRRLGWLGRTWLVLIGLLFLFTLVGVPYLFATRGAQLRLEGRSSLGEGTLTLRVDGRTLYERPLAIPADEGGLARLVGRGEEEFGAALRVTPGKHEVTAEVATVGESILTDTIVVDLQPGESRVLKLTAGHVLGRAIQIHLE